MALAIGSHGPEVKVLQEQLNKVGVTCNADGAYGPNTMKAVKTFQTASGLTADGIAGDDTQAKLTEAVAAIG
jgi:peptidoglycan hydrolase-like protein with peptidoglycan-binding domain